MLRKPVDRFDTPRAQHLMPNSPLDDVWIAGRVEFQLTS
jgi:hypothetical protein